MVLLIDILSYLDDLKIINQPFFYILFDPV